VTGRSGRAGSGIGMRIVTLFSLIPWVVGFLAGARALGADSGDRSIILATTTSTQDSGLLDILVPLFEQKSGYRVKTVSVGTGQALALAAKGDADVVLVHAPSLEKKYVAAGKLLNRRLVMYNDFVIIGPKADPAKIRRAKSAAAAFELIEQANVVFVSRGDSSGTHAREKTLWKTAGIEPKGSWYLESGQGMGATLTIANERNAYTITDRGTYLALQKRLELGILLEGDPALFNVYSVMEVNPGNGPRVKTAGAKAFSDFMIAPETQAVIKDFGVERFGRPLFVPAAGRREGDLGV